MPTLEEACAGILTSERPVLGKMIRC